MASQLTREGPFGVDDEDAELITKLVEVRIARGLSQLEVAERMGCSQQAISALEKCRGRLNLSTVRRYALAVGASLSYHVEWEGPSS
jgi:transcriptional regulator with XRE-family HTH domain